jgi:hypothetical protein
MLVIAMSGNQQTIVTGLSHIRHRTIIVLAKNRHPRA